MHYRSLVPIRCRGPLHFYSARHPESDAPRVLVMAPRVPSGEARARLANLARLHRLVAGGCVPAVAEEELGGAAPWVALHCDAVADLESAGDFVRQGGEKVEFKSGAALGKMLMETLVRAHRIRDPESGEPVCLGSLAPGNLLFSSEGRMSIVGFGGGPLYNAVIAPEVASGGVPTPGADVYAVTLFMRAQLEFVKLPPLLRLVFAGQARVAPLALLFVWSNLKVLAAPAPKRPDMEAGLAKARKMWRLLGVEPDVDGFAAWVARAIADPERLTDAPERPGIRVGPDGDWLETPSGKRYALGTRRPLRRILLALAEARRDRAGDTLTIDALLRAGWPGEDPLPEAGNNRVYVAVSTLRKLGLGELLQRWDGGYRLDPAVSCQF